MLRNLSPAWPALRERLLSIDEAYSNRAPDILTAAALIYIALPNLIFLGGWLRPPYAIVIVVLVLVGLWQFLRSPQIQWCQPYTLGALLFIVATAFAWSSLGGAGHFFYANRDWQVRDAVLGDLTLTAWPPAYSIVDGQYHILRSAIGFFLPAASLGKVAGIASVDMALYLWTAIGASLFFLLLPLQRAGRLLPFLLLVVILFSGMDFLGIVLVTGEVPIFPLNLEWWVPFSYSSLTGQLHWAPNHCLALWLVAALFYRHWGHKTFPALVVVLLPLLVIWTPFAVLGILPFLGLAVVRWLHEDGNLRDSGLTLVQVIASSLLTYLTVRVMTLGLASIASTAAPTVEVVAIPSSDSFVLKYLVFILLEFGILALLVVRHLRHSLGLLGLSAAILAALPLYHFGPSNDAMLRLSTPSLVILLILLLGIMRTWADEGTVMAFPKSAWAIALVLLIGANTPFNEMWRAFFFPHTPSNYAKSLPEQQKGVEPTHYVGALDRSDLLILLHTPSLVPSGPERIAHGLVPASSRPK